jgi:hypothetical protein
MKGMWSRLGLMLLLAAVAVLADDTPMSRIRVQVENLKGKPVDRASVIVNFDEGRSLVKLGKKVITHWEVRTNQQGIAKIPTIPQGKVLVQVIAKGYQTFGDTFDVDEEEKTITVKLNPPQAQHSEHQ